jgi:hypothetical protein
MGLIVSSRAMDLARLRVQEIHWGSSQREVG